jgi:trehalose-6-phosphate synthase/HAMP domain-containing protein
MRLAFRLVAGIWVSVMVVIAGFAYVSIEIDQASLRRDLERRATLLGDGLRESVRPLLDKPGAAVRIERAIRPHGTAARSVAVYDRYAGLVAATPELAPRLPMPLPFVSAALARGEIQQGVDWLVGRRMHYYALPLHATPGDDGPAVGVLVIFQDASHVAQRVPEVIRTNAVRFFLVAIAVSLITLLVVRWSVTHPLRRLEAWTRQLRRGESAPPPVGPDRALLGPLAAEVSDLARSLARARAAAEQEAALRLASETVWTEERLKQVVTSRLGDRPLFVVSNREPFQHVWRGRRIEVATPASGVVTALDPVMRACGGVWVAHGSADADREVVDARDSVRVPPDDPRYTLRRVWLSRAEEDGYYYGFANEGLWPLCHIVHARPIFRPEDWAQYQAVNRKFAAAVLDEMAATADPVLLIQDYHFALLPRLVREQRPDARIALFWHIPWPNPEAFGICPWQPALLAGMLGADIVGFHTQFHCNNFLETVDRAIEARIDWEHFAVVRGRQATAVKPFPISVAPTFVEQPPAVDRASLLAELGITTEFLGVGVERLDYTKGLPERFRAIGRFLERFPEYRERLTFVQLAAPSRGQIPRYRETADEVNQTIAAVNAAHETRGWRPIVMLARHHSHRDIWAYYRWADFCMVTSLHDGMNLVAKEFVSVRDDDDGVLILSQFTGAARELGDALLVNPYDVDAMADTLRAAVTMPPAERKSRMIRMRQVVREHNIYRWAGHLLTDLARLPVEGLDTRAP